MFQTRITEMFGTKYPIVVGTMMHLARAEMVAAASNAGALGVLASVIFQTQDEFRREIKKLKRPDRQAVCREPELISHSKPDRHQAVHGSHFRRGDQDR